ncbi:DUF3427 domain-containing protein [Vibrio ostreicida]|uniref:DUF3427 domain-containing protein n=1 Tax=Vibrio ostreicida TaxID=526588 RepID=A0ABT8C0V1_9VIBR|nr:DUF3427 domain-containing protein [Vibrio ostreicida]MDN3612568.1 DUF3427 domain-containing protein [Vibrio ostreicida]NPD09189.1 DUF3427 domain-containing protein [Vibrio ostreicida]
MAEIKRKNETFEYSSFVVGHHYSKLDAMALGHVAPPKQARDITGITRFSNCVVLFVTLNKENKQSAYQYQDSFALHGRMFTWESQNLNTPTTPHMQMIIQHKPVLLFARVHEKIKGRTQAFIYVGRLRCKDYSYLTDSKEIPVEVTYDVIDFQAEPSPQLNALYVWRASHEALINTSASVLLETPKPKAKKPPPATSTKRKSQQNQPNWAEIDENNRNLGLAGERLVLGFEKQYLLSENRQDLAEKIEHIALKDSDAGYDILSFDKEGKEKYIEVKTTNKSKGTAFFISRNEVKMSQAYGDQYWVYRVYSMNKSLETVNFYRLNGAVDTHVDLVPTVYKASLRKE